MKQSTEHRQRIAVIGAGIAGLASAYFLSRRHEVTLYEANRYLGGHTNTVDVTLDGQTHPVDTGFLVFNDRTYPNLIALFAELGVDAYPSDMSFAVSLGNGASEWAGTDFDTLFVQRRHLLSPRFLGMLRDILRFNTAAERHLAEVSRSGVTLGQLLGDGGYGTAFRDAYLLPMAAAIWSSATNDILRFPAQTFLRFCLNHGLLQIRNRPQWRTVLGGGRNYVQRLAARLALVKLDYPVWQVRRDEQGVEVFGTGGRERYDAVVLATHAPETLRLLADADADEMSLLGAVCYQPNLAVLHTDPHLLPRRRKVWSAWNYLGGAQRDGARPTCVSYLINKLQPLPFARPVIVTLNPFTMPDPRQELARFDYHHPLFDQAAIAAQQRLPGLQGRRRTWFAGAWTGYGFHEDGLKSALRVADDFGLAPHWARC
ncbi:FAD-dependent oxidoreductase [Crenobacter sp. SG2305]|uniref:NAD(P)/FAD-dependent oxidoreductase n=1 Tax=Crenobacter oryzisoli TaxID=3056844 RepID=UPI0025AA9C87|nr:FAD-dependent oxidoreductase [Crenobacter sp. SG2305]MDN0082839.1 FAD-dependent oxidoreductase [Crenobacter sp. SG2305]